VFQNQNTGEALVLETEKIAALRAHGLVAHATLELFTVDRLWWRSMLLGTPTPACFMSNCARIRGLVPELMNPAQVTKVDVPVKLKERPRGFAVRKARQSRRIRRCLHFKRRRGR
jgi:hypothetical protein